MIRKVTAMSTKMPKASKQEINKSQSVMEKLAKERRQKIIDEKKQKLIDEKKKQAVKNASMKLKTMTRKGY